MPVTVDEVRLSLRDQVNETEIQRVVDEVDKRLSDPMFVRDNRLGSANLGYYWEITVDGSFNQKEADTFADRYRKGKWHVSINESANDRPIPAHQMRIKLQAPPEGPIRRGS